MFEKILIANRGEIAVRVIRTCRALGIRSVAIYSDADRDAMHVRLADEAVGCGPARATESYLDGEGIVGLAQRVDADAIHPGYGFLSENVEFAERVKASGRRFIGPPPEVIRSMGSKLSARTRMKAAGLPVVPGSDRLVTASDAREAARVLGFPVLVKASAGGGGRGMRRVEDESELEAAFERSASEALASFGDGALYLERCLDAARHVEIQILADEHGGIVHLGERECSIQRRHQKLVEETPARGITEADRAAMGDAAVRAARSVGYVGAGTCEFLLDAEGTFYFLEMNTRIQVEHAITEAVTGLDLVESQIRIAAGEALPYGQDDVGFEGHAIEARVYAEDPDRGFVPSPGRISGWCSPGGTGVRLDTGFEGGETVSPHYDPMLAKLIVHADGRDQAIDRMAEALESFWIAGIRTGLPFLRRLVASPVFRRGVYDTGFLDQAMSEPPAPLPRDASDLVSAAVAIHATRSEADTTRRWRVALVPASSVDVTLLDPPSASSGAIRVRVGDREMAIAIEERDGSIADYLVGGARTRLSVAPRRAGGFDVGLRDRVQRVACEARRDP